MFSPFFISLFAQKNTREFLECFSNCFYFCCLGISIDFPPGPVRPNVPMMRFMIPNTDTIRNSTNPQTNISPASTKSNIIIGLIIKRFILATIVPTVAACAVGISSKENIGEQKDY